MEFDKKQILEDFDKARVRGLTFRQAKLEVGRQHNLLNDKDQPIDAEAERIIKEAKEIQSDLNRLVNKINGL